MSTWNQEGNDALPSLARLQETRLKRWHQTGEALLTLENLRSWLNASGLVLFAQRPQIVSPAPTMVEAVLGAPNPTPTLEQTAEARSLLGRLVAEGIAIPLNLLGAPSGAIGETPDFVASAAVFSYIFTLRGDKGWKQPPQTSGAGKVSQLAVNTHEALVRLGPQSASELARELGNEVTESAVLRALGELWTHLRVLPATQPDGRPTTWELAGTRFSKQIKAGANAGMPSALSALISLYLGQVTVATEEEIEVFLSPLAPRSRIRDVIHALTAARQLDTLAIEGRTMLRLDGETADFLPAPAAKQDQTEEAAGAADAEGGAEESPDSTEDGTQPGSPERIKKFVPKPRKIGTGYLAKGRPAKSADRPAAPRTTSRFASRSGESAEGKAGAERERRPFQKRADGDPRPFPKKRVDGADKPRFDRPWGEDKPRRSAEGAARPPRSGEGAPERRAPRRDAGKEGGWKPAARTGSRPDRPAFQGAGRAPRSQDRDGAPPRERSSFAPGAGRPGAGRSGGDRPPRAGGFGDRPGRPGGFASRPAGPRAGGGDRPGGFAKRPGGPGRASPGGSDRPFRARPDIAAGAERTERPQFRRFDAPRSPAKRSLAPRTGDGERPARPRTDRARSDRGGDDRPKREFRPREGASAGPRESRGGGKFSPRPQGGSASGPRGGFAGKRSGPGTESRGPRREGGFSSRPPGGGGFSRKPPARDRPERSEGGGGYSRPAGERPPRRKFRPEGRPARVTPDPQNHELKTAPDSKPAAATLPARKPVIAIDGPAGAGKSTLAAHLARRFGFLNLETGAMYRALALKAIENDLDFEDEAPLLELAAVTRITLNPTRGQPRPAGWVRGLASVSETPM